MHEKLRLGIMVRVTRMIHDTRSVAADLLDELGPIIAGERAAFAQRCHTRSISMTHLLLMTLLETHGSLPMSRVAELLGCGLPAATGIVSRMEERGLVERQHDNEDDAWSRFVSPMMARARSASSSTAVVSGWRRHSPTSPIPSASSCWDRSELCARRSTA